MIRATAVTYSLAALALLAAGAGGGLLWSHRATPPASAAPASASPPATQRQALYWYDPMMPDQHFDKPGKSPFMDMQLVPRYAAQADDAGAAGSAIDPALQQSVGIRTARVEVAPLQEGIRATGSISWNPREEALVSARAEGVVSQLQVDAPYTRVTRGQPLATVLAPGWSTAVAEAHALASARSSDARDLQAAAIQRLHVLGADGRAGRDGSITLAAPRDGIVTALMVRQGQAIASGSVLFRINGNRTVWLQVAVPQGSVAGLAAGDSVDAQVSAVPGVVLHGRIDTLLPQLDSSSRTQPARVVLDNPGGVLADGMFADVTLHPAAGPAHPLVPSEALIATGTDSRVIVRDLHGHFVPVRVTTGRSSGGRTQILAGLQGGEEVVVSGQFLLDSEASLSGALQRLGDAGAAMDMPMEDAP